MTTMLQELDELVGYEIDYEQVGKTDTRKRILGTRVAKPTASFTTLAGVAVHYDRHPIAKYGSRGVARRFYAQPDFIEKLERCFDELWRISPYGRAEVITSAGAYVDKKGQHGLGRAFDLDGIFWPDKEFVTLHDGQRARDRKLYYGVECVLRKHFGQVLNFSYNQSHHDHFHIDTDMPVGLRKSSKAVTVFVQGVLRHVYGLAVAIDGQWGALTEQAVGRAAAAAGLTVDYNSLAGWLQFLSLTAARAFDRHSRAY
jgi:hypothetical protein